MDDIIYSVIKWTDIFPISNFLQAHGYKQIIYDIVFDTVPTYIIIYPNKTFDFLIYPADITGTKFLTIDQIKKHILNNELH